MLRLALMVLLVIWLLGYGFHVGGGYIHLLLVLITALLAVPIVRAYKTETSSSAESSGSSGRGCKAAEAPADLQLPPPAVGSCPSKPGLLQAVLQGVAGYSEATERKRLEKRRAAQHAITRILAESKVLAEAASRIVQAVCEALDWTMGAIWIVDEQQRALRCLETWHVPSAQVGEFEKVCRDQSFFLGIGVLGSVWLSRQPAWIPDVTKDPNFLRADSAAANGLHAAFGFPIMLGSEVLGVSEFFSHEIREPDADLLQMMAAVGTQIGQFIERQRAETILRKSQKLVGSGRLLGAVAHELKNPLEAMTNLLYLLERSRSLDNRAREFVSRIGEELTRMKQITAHTLGLYRDSSKPMAVNLQEVLDAAIDFYAGKIRFKQIRIEKRYECAGVVRAFPGEVRQVFTNLLVNALEAVPSGGRVTLHLRNSRDWSGAGASGIRLVIADNGPGISPEHRRKIFEPFFTTKADKGTGLGLWVTRELIEKHGGSIRVRSKFQQVGSGAIFSMFLPLKLVSAPGQAA